MAYVTPTTRADGYVVDAAEWNKNTVDNPIAIKTGTVTLDLVTSAGLVDLSGASAGQIKFPASQNASADANTLDDYEESFAYTPTWSSAGTPPSLGDGSIVGHYIKIGRMVHLYVLLTMGGTTTYGGADAWTLSLPFSAQSGLTQLGVVRTVDGGTVAYTGVAIVATGASVMTLNTNAAPVAVYNATSPITWASTDTLSVSISYIAAA
jgi:hypothetical protein